MQEHQLIELTGIFILGVSAQWVAWWLRLPSILLLLLLGLLAGPVFGWLDPDHLLGDLLFPVVSLSVGVILFEGGLSLRLSDLSNIGSVVQRLVTLGAVVTLAGASAAAYLILGLNLELSLLLGAVLVVTGPTVVGPLLKHVRPSGHVGPTLRWEGILIDPIGAIVGVLIFDAVLSRELANSFQPFLTDLLLTFGAGLGIGLLAAALLTLALQRYLIPDHLHNPVTLLFLIAAFAVSNTIADEAGLLAVTVMGVAVGNQSYVPVRHITELQESLGAMLIGILFVLLASRLSLEELKGVLNLETLAFLVVLILVVRPLAVLVSTVRSGLDVRERVFVAGVAPRGIVAAAVASLFALRLTEAGVQEASVLAPLTFAVIIGTVTVYGLSAVPLARALGLSQSNPQGLLMVGAHRFALAAAEALTRRGHRVVIVDSNLNRLLEARLMGLETYHGNILARETADALDVGGIGRLLAMTGNDELNSLAVLNLRHIFGRANCYQLEADAVDGEQPANAIDLQGRRLFASHVTLGRLVRMIDAGATVRATLLSDRFTFDDLQELAGNRALPLFLEYADGSLHVVSSDVSVMPRPGQTLISLVPGDTPPRGPTRETLKSATPRGRNQSDEE